LTLAQDRFGHAAASPGQSNDGWNPWGQNGQGGFTGPSDTTHSWINVGATDAAGLFALTGTELRIVWGSPNDDNTVTFYSDAKGLDPIGSIDETSLFNPATDNTGAPGFLTLFTSTTPFDSVSFAATNGSAFEFAVLVPEASTWAMMLAGFAGLGFLGFRRSRRAVALSL
jgi:hypothetical protein